ncbi:ATPase [Nocardia sp. CDC159]|uniref:ATPase n=1 Tax=Nocardia pulmonis TaxID=2951408 RepID=A0A9X2E8Y0_9NOCA|nr:MULTISPECIES: ATPase [Nocardia]MCM6773668.1 ATPase [Nocardia pulmonis]MCM6786555.1 ATPase [Nocardia sp. CDC159]
MSVSTEVLFIGGRSGVGKSSVGCEVHTRLSVAEVRHCLIEGDFLDMACPPTSEDGLAERNLAAMWTNYRALGYRRLIYVNTASVIEDVIDELTAAMGDRPAVTAVLLTCTDQTARERLSRREIGTALTQHLERSARAARRLNDFAPDWVHRVQTDDRSVTDIAAQIIALSGWLPDRSAGSPLSAVAGDGREVIGERADEIA